MTTEIQRAPQRDPYNLVGVLLEEKFEIVEPYDVGGMGFVYRGRDIKLYDQNVAIKVLFSIKPGELEGLALSKLEHPNIVRIRAQGTTSNGMSYLVMDWIPDKWTLKHIPLLQVAGYLDALASALDFAHRKGVLHRDVKLANIRLNSIGQPVLLDFGIAKLLDHEEGSTVRNSSALGTAYYKAPETWLDVPEFLPESDQYSLAVLLYQLVTEHLPFKLRSPAGSQNVLAQWSETHLNASPTPPHEYRKDLPLAAEAVMLKALSKDSNDRYRNCTEFAKAFRNALGPVAVPPARGGTRGSNPPVRLLLLAIVVLTIILVGGGVILFTGSNHTPTSAVSGVPITVSPAPPAIRINSTNSPEPPMVEGATITPVPATLSPVLSPVPEMVAQVNTPEPILDPTAAPPMTASELPTSTVTVTPSPIPSMTPSSIPSATLTNTAQQMIVVSSSTPTATQTVDIIATALAQTQTAISQATGVPLTVNALLTQTATNWTRTPTSTPTTIPTPIGGGRSGQIAFSSNRSGHTEIYLIYVDGTNLIDLTKNLPESDEPSWSPDGKELVFMLKQDGTHWQIYKMNVDGSSIVRLTNNTTEDGAPVWSPDGSSIVFWSTRDGTQTLYVMNSDGSNQRRLSRDINGASPVWSPDGKQILFRSMHDNIWDLFMMNADGTNVRQITKIGGISDRPFWSAKTGLITFHSTSDAVDPSKQGQWDIFVMSADGSNVHRLTSAAPLTNADPFWSPDGTQIAYFAGDLTGTGPIMSAICVLEVQSLHNKCITDGNSFNRYPRWRP